MEALMQKKITEAQQHVANAEKSMKTSLFKRKPDLDSAANSYSQASSCYKVAKDLNKSIDFARKSAECYNQNNSLYNAAKQHEQIGFMANELKNYKLAFESFHNATELLITNGTRDSAGILLEKGANMLKLTDPESSLKLYKRALQVSDIEDKHHEMLSFYENAITIAVKINHYDEAIELINDSFNVLDRVGSQEQITKYILTAVIMHLSKDDWVSAKKYLDGMKNRYQLAPDSRGFGRVDDLINAYDQKDDDAFKNLIKNYLSYAVDNEILKIANKIVKTDEWIKHAQENSLKNKPAPVQQTNTYYQQSAGSQPASISQPSVQPKINDFASRDTAPNAHETSQPSANNDEDKDEFEDGLL